MPDPLPRAALSSSVACSECGGKVIFRNRDQWQTFRKKGRAFCSLACVSKCHSRESSERMARTNRVHASTRMLRNNPMHQDASREKMKGTLRAIGHRPSVRGGNGKGMTVPQATFLAALGDEWTVEFVVLTGAKRGSGMAYCYKIDIAQPGLKIAIEVDGRGHNGKRKDLDRKKDDFLISAGWSVLRFTNAAVLNSLTTCVQAVSSLISVSKERILTLPTA